MSTPTPTTGGTSATATKAASGKNAAPVSLRPFFTGSLDLETHTYRASGNISANPTPLPTFSVRTNGWLDSLWVSVTVTTASNAATTAFVENGPVSSIQTITFSDSGGQPIIGPMSGWELGEFVKMGGFSTADDFKASQTYSSTVGSSGTGGSFSFALQIPITFVRREPLGSLPNTNNNTAFTVDITLAPTASIYTTAPTNPGAYAVEIWQDAFRQSAGKDSQQNPTVTDVPGKGATLYLLRNTLDGLAPGNVNTELAKQTGSYRALGFVLTDSNNSRAQGESDWFDPCRIHLNNDTPYDRRKRQWVRKMERQYEYLNANETAGGRSNGSFWHHPSFAGLNFG